MKALSWRVQVGIVVAGYAAVAAISVFLIVTRYWLYKRHPEDVAAAGGMYAAGDSMLAIFIACMLLIATLGLVIVIRNSEVAYTHYAQFLLGLSLTSPLSAAVLNIRAISQGNSIWGWICMFRMEVSPVVIVGLFASWLAARFKPAKRWAFAATLIETVSLIVVIAAVVLAGRSGSE